jgi:hypothetical protein
MTAMSMPELPPPEHNDPHARWRLIRDVLYFQLKLVLGNLQNFLLLPVSLAAALADLLFKGEREGQRFYWVLDWGRRTDEAINIYGAIGGYHATGGEAGMDPRYTVDAVLARVEEVIVREYQKGGAAANVKGAVDKVLDEMQSKTEGANDALRAAAEKLKEKMDKP